MSIVPINVVLYSSILVEQSNNAYSERYANFSKLVILNFLAMLYYPAIALHLVDQHYNYLAIALHLVDQHLQYLRWFMLPLNRLQGDQYPRHQTLLQALVGDQVTNYYSPALQLHYRVHTCCMHNLA